MTRMIIWLPLWGFFQFIWFLFIFSGSHDIITNPIIRLIVAGIPLYLYLLSEYGIYRERKKKGWSYWKDVTKEWKKRD